MCLQQAGPRCTLGIGPHPQPSLACLPGLSSLQDGGSRKACPGDVKSMHIWGSHRKQFINPYL